MRTICQLVKPSPSVSYVSSSKLHKFMAFDFISTRCNPSGLLISLEDGMIELSALIWILLLEDISRDPETRIMFSLTATSTFAISECLIASARGENWEWQSKRTNC